MALNITKFFDKRPYLPYRFEVEIYYRTKIDVPYRYMVQSISFPHIEGSLSDSSIFLGNSIVPLNIYNMASRQLEITFEESDNMDVTKLLTILNKHAYSGVSELVGIIVYEYDSSMRINLNTSKIYKCKITSYENPSFSRTGSVNVVTVSATFTVFSESPYSDDNKSAMIKSIASKDRNRNQVKNITANDIISINKEKSILKANPQYNVNLVTPQAPQGGYGGMGGGSSSYVPGTPGAGTGSGKVYTEDANKTRYDYAIQGIKTHEGTKNFKVYKVDGDVPTVGYGMTHYAMKAGVTDFYLTNGTEIVRINSQESINKFRTGAYIGWSISDANGNTDVSVQENIAFNMVKTRLKDKEAGAKKQTKSLGVDYDNLSEMAKGVLIDAYYNGAPILELTTKALKYKKENGSMPDKATIKGWVESYKWSDYDKKVKFFDGWTNRIFDDASQINI